MAKKRRDIEKDIEDKLGFVPEFYRAMPDAALGGAWSMHSELELDETELDGKTKELIGLAVASHIKCKYCIYFHSRVADAYGASDQEIREAIAMGGLTTLFSNNISGTQTDFDEFKRDVEKLIEVLK